MLIIIVYNNIVNASKHNYFVILSDISNNIYIDWSVERNEQEC